MKTEAEIPSVTDADIPLLNCMAEEPKGDIEASLKKYQRMMSENGAFIRNTDGVTKTLGAVESELEGFFENYKVSEYGQFRKLVVLYDVLNAQKVYLSAIKKYIEDGGKSRGSYLINGDPSPDTENTSRLCYAKLNDNEIEFRYENARPIPESEQWFEKVYNAYRKKMM